MALRIRLSRFRMLARPALSVPRQMAEKPLLGFFFMLALAGCIAAAVFWQTIFVPRSSQVGVIVQPVRFQEQTLLRIVSIWEERAERFQAADGAGARNIFAP